MYEVLCAGSLVLQMWQSILLCLWIALE